MLRRALIAMLLCTLGVTLSVAHGPPGTSNDQAMYAQVTNGTGQASCVSIFSTFRPVTVGQSYLIVTGGTDTNGAGGIKTGWSVSVIENDANSTSGYSHLAYLDAAANLWQGGANAHLLKFQNGTISGDFAFFSVLEVVPTRPWIAVGMFSSGSTVGSGSADPHAVTSWGLTGTTGYLGPFLDCPRSNAGTPVGFLFNRSVEFPTVPDAPILSGALDERDAVLSWTTPDANGGTILGYNITRRNHDGSVTLEESVGLVNTWTERAGTRNRTYTVTAYNEHGTSPASNNVTLRFTMDLFGEQGAIYGGDREALAAAADVSPFSLDLLLGLVFVLIFAGAGWMSLGTIGAVAGAVAGVLAAMAIGFFPVWLIVLLIAFAAATFLLVKTRGSGA